MSSAKAKILIIGPSWVGDMVMAQSLCIDLRKRHPDAIIDMLAPAWTAALIDRMPEVDHLVAVDFKHGKLSLGERWHVGKSLRSKRYTQAIVLPNSIKAALVPAFAKIPQRTGFVGEQRWGLLNDIRKLDKQKLPMTVQRFVALGRTSNTVALPISRILAPLLKVDARQAAEVAAKLGLDTQSKIVALCPGAEFGASKQWPAEHYAQTAQEFLDQGWQAWLLGSEKDRGICADIAARLRGSSAILAGQTSLPEAVDLMSLAQLVVSNDSGLMHIAAGLNRPLVAVYGSTDPGHTPPLSNNHRVARLGLECSPCFKRECPLQHHNCMRQLLPAQVLELSQELLP